MDFTEVYKQTASLVSFSPGTHFLLTAVQDRLVVRRSDSFQVARTWHVDPTSSPTVVALSNQTGARAALDKDAGDSAWITHAGWSCDSEYVMGACARRGIVAIFKLRDDEWSARIEAGAEGLVKAEWAPDGRTVVCFSEWGLRVTLWSLVTGAATYIQFPIHPDRGYAFREDARYFILAERHKSRDTLGVYDTSESYRLVRHFPLPTSSLASMVLSPTGNHLAVWEGPLEFKLFIVSLNGDLLGTFTPDPDLGFGVRTVAWHPSGMLLAVAGADDKVYILESLTWGPIATLELPSRITSNVNIWREPTDWLESTQGRGFLSYERIQPPFTLPATTSQVRPRSNPTSAPRLAAAARSSPTTTSRPSTGTVQLAFNATGTLLLVRSASAPTAVLLYAFPPQTPHAPQLRSVLLHTSTVASARWSPDPRRAGRLAVCCAAPSMYLWSDEWVEPGADDAEVAECIGVPAPRFEARDVRWAPDGKGLVLLDRETFCCAFEVEDEEGDDANGPGAG